MDLTPDCSPEVLDEAINFMYGKDINEQFDDFAGLLDASERFMMDDFKIEIGKRMVRKVQLNKDNYMEICGLANKYKVEAVADYCADYIHFEATSAEVDWEALKKLPVIAVSSMMLLGAKFERMKGYSGCTNGSHSCTCSDHAAHTCSLGPRHHCNIYGHYCTYTGPACACCTYAKVIAENMG
jgi:hypothetical protein